MWFRVIPLALLGLGLAIAGAAPAYAEAVIQCSSREFRDNYCPADTRGGVRLARQVSRAACDEGRTWGYDRRGVWVSDGCEGEFMLGGERGGGRRARGFAPRGGELVVCESRDFRYRHCATRGGDARLARQISKSECRYGVTWGHERGGIWVDRGCGAEFAVRQ